ncbi:DUF1993 domain-containing protein [Fontimonas sp. SYSU GA230001]|uniref:DUF1993 domain-containing protein n=1 Tax=Fontimonas sp. SYSU GA230001 TaxID=3142450 RepID=UPI0032B49B37
MALSMYAVSIPVVDRALANLAHVLAKAEAHAEARRLDPAVLLGDRLYPDMLPLIRQVQIAADIAKGCAARLAGREPPVYEDAEATFAELQSRIARTREFIGSVPAAEIDASESRSVTIKLRGEPVTFPALTYLQYFVLPNVFFHCATAYAILRHNGVELGKADFLGKP